VLHGRADPLVPVAAGADIATTIPGAVFRVFEGMGHDVPPELFDEIARAIADFTKL
jgi:proline iminopeptidase